MKVKEKILTQWDLVKARSDELMDIKEPATMTQDFINTLGHKYLLNRLEVETKAIGHRGIIKGFGSTYDVDEGRDKIIPGAFTEDLPKFAKNPVMLFSHWMDKVLGVWTVFEEQAQGLYLEGEINLKTQLGKDTYTLIGDNDIKGLSIGYSILKRAYDDENEILELLKLRLWETSVVAIPMNQNAWITGTKIFTGADIKKAEVVEDEIDIDKILPHHVVKISSEDTGIDWNKLALAMCKLMGARGGLDIDDKFKEEIWIHLGKHYVELDKQPPSLESDFDERREFKDIDWKEDEKFILECANLDGSLQASINILKYFITNDRIQSVDKKRLAEMLDILKSFDGINPEEDVTDTSKTDEQKEKDLDEILDMVKGLKGRIADVKKFDIGQAVKVEIRKALSEATGKDL